VGGSRRFESVCAAVAGASYLAVGITHFLLPRDQIHFATGIRAGFFASVAAQPTAFTVHYWAFAVASLAAIGVVVSFRAKWPGHYSVSRDVISLLGVVGCVVNAVNFLLLLAESLQGAQAYATLDATSQALMVAQGLHTIDPFALFGFGLTGLWLLVSNAMIYSSRQLPRWLALAGLGGGIGFELVFVGKVLHVAEVIDAAAGVAIVVGPVWYFGVAINSWRQLAPPNKLDASGANVFRN
jgi:hypothetical protein